MKQKINSPKWSPAMGNSHLSHGKATPTVESGSKAAVGLKKADLLLPKLPTVKQPVRKRVKATLSDVFPPEPIYPDALAAPNECSPANLPTLPDYLFDTLPTLLKKVVAMADTKEERDIMLLGSMVTLGSCLPGFYALYDGKVVYANLYLYITAPASAGKGKLVYCKQLVKPIHDSLRQQTQVSKEKHALDLQNYLLLRGKDLTIRKPIRPPELMLFIPANNSTTGIFQLLFENKGKGLIFETEGDILAQAFKSDYGNYSNAFCKAFHHESISYYRRTDREYVVIDSPCLSAVLSSTPEQVASLIPNAGNGLFSRFIFYHMDIKPVWKDVFAANRHKGLEAYFDRLGKEFFPFYQALKNHSPIEFSLSAKQQVQFNAFFAQIQEKYGSLQGLKYIATVRRLALIAYRLAMVFTALRMLESGDLSSQKGCSKVDFEASLDMIRVLVRHSSYVFSELLGDKPASKPKDRMEQFLAQLPAKFSAQDFQILATSMSINQRSAARYITLFCEKGLVRRENHGEYIVCAAMN